MKTKVISMLLILSAISFSFKPEGIKRHYFKIKGKFVDETITGYTSDITGANDVKVVFDRTGSDAGVYDAIATFYVTYNGQGSYVEYTLDIGTGTHYEGHIQGPNPTGDAEMRGDISLTYY